MDTFLATRDGYVNRKKLCCPKCGSLDLTVMLSAKCKGRQADTGILELDIVEDSLDILYCANPKCGASLDTAKALESLPAYRFGDPEWGTHKYVCGILRKAE